MRYVGNRESMESGVLAKWWSVTFFHCHKISVQLSHAGSGQFGLLAPSGNSSSLLCEEGKKLETEGWKEGDMRERFVIHPFI